MAKARTIAIGVMAFGLTLTGACIVVGRVEFDRGLPPVVHRDVRVRCGPGAECPWPGVERAIDSIVDVSAREYPKKPSLAKHLIIELRGDLPIPTSSGLANGTVKLESGPLSPTYHTMVVRQIPGGPGHSALFHEFAQHVAAMRLHQTPNHSHAIPVLDALEQAIADDFAKGPE